MTIFERVANVRERIQKTKNKIELLEMKADTPRSSVFSDMPKGVYSASNPLEQYVIEKEELDERLKKLEIKFDRLWHSALKQMGKAKIGEQEKHMMYIRFRCGLQWEKVADALNKQFPDSRWNVNKCFRKYREVLYKTRKANCE